MVIDNPLVSIIMNCHNGEKYLREAIDSIYAQTYSNWEIIFWDNASTDASKSIAMSYSHKLKYFYNSEKTSLGKARNLACKKAEGDYLAFLDVDDLWCDNKLTDQINLISNSSDIGFVYGRSEILNMEDETVDIFMDGKKLPEGYVFKELMKGDFVPFCSALIDARKFFEIGGFPSHYNNSTDYWVFLHLAHKYKVLALQDVCCTYRWHESNASRSQVMIRAYENIDLLSRFVDEDGGNVGLQYQYVNLALSCLLEKNYYQALKVMFVHGGWSIFLKRILLKVLKK